MKENNNKKNVYGVRTSVQTFEIAEEKQPTGKQLQIYYNYYDDNKNIDGQYLDAFAKKYHYKLYEDFRADPDKTIKKIKKHQYKFIDIQNAEGMTDDFIKKFFDDYTTNVIGFVLKKVMEQRTTRITNIEMYDLIEVCENEKIENIKRDKLGKLKKIYTQRLNMLYNLRFKITKDYFYHDKFNNNKFKKSVEENLYTFLFFMKKPIENRRSQNIIKLPLCYIFFDTDKQQSLKTQFFRGVPFKILGLNYTTDLLYVQIALDVYYKKHKYKNTVEHFLTMFGLLDDFNKSQRPSKIINKLFDRLEYWKQNKAIKDYNPKTWNDLYNRKATNRQILKSEISLYNINKNYNEILDDKNIIDNEQEIIDLIEKK